MPAIATYVFIDLETSGLPEEENNRTKITELSLVAVKRQHLLETRKGYSPRVQQKLTLCLNPGRLVQPEGSKITGLSNDLLEHEPLFNMEVFGVIDSFLNVLTKPVCLIAYNGHTFDFPILKRHLVKLSVSFADDLMCADCYHGFYDIMTKMNIASKLNVNINNKENMLEKELNPDTDETDFYSENTLSAQVVNESTPKKQYPTRQMNKTPQKQYCHKPISKVRRRFPWSEGEKPTEKYKLKDVYYRLLNRNAVDAHRAENDCLLTLESAVVLENNFVEWIDENHCLFSEVKPMTVGLLLLTGALWGCTNPFIRQGTRGLRKVKANTMLGQACAEITFLLSNWRYVIPWFVNQLGSLVYLAAVQRVPLSLAVPAANSLAFAFTALIGAAVGIEKPLDLGSIVGIILIGVGTALCCWDKADE